MALSHFLLNMSAEHGTFATAVGCMDGRVQDPVAAFAKDKWGVDYVDAITEAGLVKHFAEPHEEGPHTHPHTQHILETIKMKVIDVSVQKHNSRGIVVHGHTECAGNPVSDEQQRADILAATSVIREMEPGVEVVPVFLTPSEPMWKVEVLSE